MSENYLPIQLPSQCLTYKDVEPGGITLRPYCGEDEFILAQINPVNIERNYLTILKRVVKGIDPKILTLGDRFYIIVWEYVNSYSENIYWKQTCSHCLQEVEFCVNMLNIENISLPNDYKEPFERVLPSGRKISLRLLTVGDEVEIEKFSGKNPDLEILYREALSIVDEKNVLERIEDLKKWSTKDTASIRAFHEDMYHGPDMRTTTVCSKCGGEEVVEVPFRLDFFFPSGETLAKSFGKRI